jgi:hypothetical protein
MNRASRVLLPVLCLLACGPMRDRACAQASPDRLKVLGLSLLLPGLGHRELGEGTRSIPYLAAEAAIWTAFGIFQTQGRLRKDSYVDMAGLFAGVDDPKGRKGEYYRRLGTYRTSDEYDDEVRRDARSRYGDDLAGRASYFERHRVPDDQKWAWTSREEWQLYRDKRGDSNRSFKRSGYMIGFAVANRLVASIDAILLVHKRSPEASWNLYLHADPFDPEEPARLHLAYSFR